MYTNQIIPKDSDGALRVLVIGRVSTVHQDIGNLEASYAYAERILKPLYSGEMLITHLGEQGSGMRTDRITILRACQLIDSGEIDVVLMEDLSKPYRNPRWIYAFVQDCVDEDVRVIAPGDNLDTGTDNWEVTLGAAALRHGLHIPDTRRRVRRTADKAFQDGGQVMRLRFGYRKLTRDEAKALDDHPDDLLIAKDEKATRIILDLRDKIVHKHRYGKRIADWLNENGVPTGPYGHDEWTWPVILDLLRDPILYGLRQHRKMTYQPVFKTGKHKRIRNDQPDQKLWPQLAHMTEQQWDELQQALDRLSPGPNGKSGRDHPRTGVSRYQSICPGQHARCDVCGEFAYPVGNGDIKCQNAFPRRGEACWNHVQAKAALVRERLIDLLLARVDAHPEGRRVMFDAAWEAIQEHRGRVHQAEDSFEQQLADLRDQEDGLLEAVAMARSRKLNIERLVEKLSAIQDEMKRLEQRRSKKSARESVLWPMSRDELDVDAREALLQLARVSFGFSDFLRTIVPDIRIRPVQALDTGQVHPRALITLDLTALWPTGAAAEDRVEHLTLELFNPPEKIRWVPDVLRIKEELKARNPKQCGYVNIAKQLTKEQANRTGKKIGPMTVKRALAYKRLMDDEGLAEPYRVLWEKPANASRWRRREQRD